MLTGRMVHFPTVHWWMSTFNFKPSDIIARVRAASTSKYFPALAHYVVYYVFYLNIFQYLIMLDRLLAQIFNLEGSSSNWTPLLRSKQDRSQLVYMLVWTPRAICLYYTFSMNMPYLPRTLGKIRRLLLPASAHELNGGNKKRGSRCPGTVSASTLSLARCSRRVLTELGLRCSGHKANINTVCLSTYWVNRVPQRQPVSRHVSGWRFLSCLVRANVWDCNMALTSIPTFHTTFKLLL